MKTRWMLVGSVLTLIAVAALIVLGGQVLAQQDTDEPTPEPEPRHHTFHFGHEEGPVFGQIELWLNDTSGWGPMRHLGEMMDIPPEELDEMLAAGLALAESLADSELTHREMFNLANTFEDYDALERLAELLGITVEELTHSLQEGQSLAEIAEAHGMTAEALVDAIVAEAEAMLDEAVAAGDLDAEQAAAILDFVGQAVEFILDKPLDSPHAMGFPMGPGLGLHLRDMDWPDFEAFTFTDPLTVAAETIGITRGELLQALREGQRLAEIAEAHGVDPQDVRDAQKEAIEQALSDLPEGFPHLDITIEGLDDLPMPPGFFFGKQWDETHGDWEQGHHPWLGHWFNCCPCDEAEGGE